MNTLHLKYAVEVERAGSITKAADILYMNQPNLSKAIRDLEETLGTVIFKRTPSGVKPTKKGEVFLAYARNILAQLEKMEALMADGDVKRRSFNIAVPRASYVSHAFTDFVASLPDDAGIDVDYRETNSVQTIIDVVDGESNLGVIRFRSEYEHYFMNVLRERNLDYHVVREFEYLMLMSSKHPLAPQKIVKCSDLDDFIEITHGDVNVPSLPISFGMAGNDAGKRKIAVYERGSQLELLNRVVGTYMWVSPMPESVLSMFSLVQRKCDMTNNDHKDILIYRKGYRLTDEDKLFVRKLEETVARTNAHFAATSA